MPFSKECTRLGIIASSKINKEKRIKRIEEYNKNPKICKQINCNNPIPYGQKHIQIFCSHTCSALNSNINRRKSPILYCKTCNKKLNSDQKISCSKKCRDIYWLNKTESMINQGKIKDPVTIKRYLIKKYGKQCFVCKRKNWMKKEVPLDLDHIDGHHENNFPENIRLICLNCHGQTPTYKAKNKGNGRKSRRKSG